MTNLFFENPLGFFGLLGLPVVVVIHFFQQPARRLEISTLFLLDSIAPESLRGTVFERLRHSLPLWLQLLMVLILTWLLVDPHWVQKKSGQTAVIVLDSSASMSAFRKEALDALEKVTADLERGAEETEWLLMESHLRRNPLYRGKERAGLLASLEHWRPTLGRHDFQPALELAQTRQGSDGLTLLITDSEHDAIPGTISVLEVGRPLNNCGFAGLRVGWEEDGLQHWKTLVRNYSDEPSVRSWKLLLPSGETGRSEMLQFEANQTRMLSGTFPPGQDRVELVLEEDDFSLDDRIPVIKPVSKTVRVWVESRARVGEYMKKWIERMPEVKPATNLEDADVIVSSSVTGYIRELSDQKAKPRIVFRLARKTAGKFDANPVLPEKHPLVDDLNWQGLLTSGPGSLELKERDQVLLWQGGQPLVFLRENRTRDWLFINFDFQYSNADRLPAFLLLLHRFVEKVVDQKWVYHARNVQTQEWLEFGDVADSEALSVQWFDGISQRTGHVGQRGESGFRAPDQPGFFRVSRGEEAFLDGAAYFNDSFESDLRHATSGGNLKAAIRSLRQKNSQPDPFRVLWLLLFAAVLALTWWLQPFRRAI